MVVSPFSIQFATHRVPALTISRVLFSDLAWYSWLFLCLPFFDWGLTLDLVSLFLTCRCRSIGRHCIYIVHCILLAFTFLGLTCLPSLVLLAHRMYYLWAIFFVVVHNFGITEKASAQSEGASSLSLVAGQNRPNQSLAAVGGATVDPQNTGCPSQQGSWTFGTYQTAVEIYNVEPRQSSLGLAAGWSRPHSPTARLAGTGGNQ